MVGLICRPCKEIKYFPKISLISFWLSEHLASDNPIFISTGTQSTKSGQAGWPPLAPQLDQKR